MSTKQLLRWQQPRWTSRHFELYAGDTLLATLAQDKGMFSSAMSVYSADQQLQMSLEPSGLLKPKLDISLGEFQLQQAPIIEWKSTGQINIEFASGQRFYWKRLSYWRSEYTLLDEMDNPLALCKRDGWGGSGTIELFVDDVKPSYLSTLLYIGLTIFILNAQVGDA